jgi:hypothetical protein
MGQNNTYPTPSGLHPETEKILLKLGLDPIKVRAFAEGANDIVNNPPPPTPGNILTAALDTVKGPEGALAELAKRTGTWVIGHSLDKLLHPGDEPATGNDFGDPNAPQPDSGGTANASAASPSPASGGSQVASSGADTGLAPAADGDGGLSGTDSALQGGGGKQDAGGDTTAQTSASLSPYDPATFTDQDEAELTPDAASWNAMMNGAEPDLLDA